MILAIDIGNTNIALGIYENAVLTHFWRVGSDVSKTGDEYLVIIDNLFRINKLDPQVIEVSVLASVVSPLSLVFQETISKLTGKTPHLAGVKSFQDMVIKSDFPSEIGSDRLVNALAGFEEYREALIIIDFGTATTFDVISGKGEFLGGVIAPGLGLSLEALVSKAFKLPKVKLIAPETVIGKNTVHCMQSGILHGYSGMVDSMVEKISRELNHFPRVIATGGLSKLIQPLSSTIEIVIEDLTLKGLFILGQRLIRSENNASATPAAL